MKPKFSVLIVTLNAELEIDKTIRSIQKQTYPYYEVIVKDGMSQDCTLQHIPKEDKYRILKQKDSSVYDGMNQAIDAASGDFFIFMNAGDSFYDEYVMEKIACFVGSHNIAEKAVLYGDYCRNGDFIQVQSKKLSPFLLYRRPLCHQSMFYSKSIFQDGIRYNTAYKISADHDLTVNLWTHGIPFYHTGIVICTYTGGGISETKKGLIEAKKEKSEIVKQYYTVKQRVAYKFIVACSFMSLRAWLDSDNSPQALRNMYRAIRNILLR